MQFVDFPKAELAGLRHRVVNLGYIYTTRVSEETCKYKLSEVVDSPLEKLRVVELRQFFGLQNHPFLGELHEFRIRELLDYDAFCLMKLARTHNPYYIRNHILERYRNM